MLQHVTQDPDDKDSVYIRFHTDGNLFSLRRLQAHTKTKEKLTRELLFADDADFVAHTESAMQRITSCFTEAAQLFTLEVNLKKTEVLHPPAPQAEYHTPSISVEQSELKAVHQFSYLGCVVTSDAKIDKEVDNRPVKANSAFRYTLQRCHGFGHLSSPSASHRALSSALPTYHPKYTLE